MSPQSADLLSQLRDIHGAPPAPWWPPAPGWWILGALLLAALVLVLHRAWRHWRRRRQRLERLRWADRIERRVNPAVAPEEFLACMNRLLKWVAMEAFPDRGCASLQGSAWTRFIARHMGDVVDPGALEALAEGPYQPHPEFDAAAVSRLVRQWIRRHG